MIIIGIDPGMGGGIAALNHDGSLMDDIYHMPLKAGKTGSVVDGRSLAYILCKMRSNNGVHVHAYVEAVASRPRQAGVFQFGLNTGIVHGVLDACGIEFTLVAPARWKAMHGLKRREGESQASQKTAARELAARLWPDHASKFARVKDDGVAEAALIALYGYHQNQQP